MIVCSACGTAFPPGLTKCPICSLPVRAMEVPVENKRRASAGSIVLALAAFSIFVMTIVEAMKVIATPDIREPHKGLLTDLHSGKLSAPEAFQVRCGKASSEQTHDGKTLLVYSNLDTHVLLEPNKPPRFFRVMNFSNDQGGYRTIETPIAEEIAIEHLQCTDR
jgi:hypothetical protein